MIYSRELTSVFEIIEKMGGTAMLVGGCVRDFFLTRKPIEEGDIDIAVALPVNKVAEIFKNSGAKVITKYATNIVVLNGKVFELTSTRKDTNHDGRYAEMIFTPSFEEDSKRRDFTINALYLTKQGQILDFHNGMEDLKNKKVRFIGNPMERIEEDYLRIWRFFRFSCLYSNSIDEEGLNACNLKKDGLGIISAERVTHEMLKLLTADPKRINYILQKMIEVGILPESSFFLSQNLPEDAFLRLAVLTKAKIVSLFLYTSKQKRLLKQYEVFQNASNAKAYLYQLYYTLPAAEFENILIIADFLGALPGKKVDFKNLPFLPFSYSTIIEEGFKNAEISRQFKVLLEKFIQEILLSSKARD